MELRSLHYIHHLGKMATNFAMLNLGPKPWGTLGIASLLAYKGWLVTIEAWMAFFDLWLARPGSSMCPERFYAFVSVASPECV